MSLREKRSVDADLTEENAILRQQEVQEAEVKKRRQTFRDKHHMEHYIVPGLLQFNPQILTCNFKEEKDCSRLVVIPIYIRLWVVEAVLSFHSLQPQSGGILGFLLWIRVWFWNNHWYFDWFISKSISGCILISG